MSILSSLKAAASRFFYGRPRFGGSVPGFPLRAGAPLATQDGTVLSVTNYDLLTSRDGYDYSKSAGEPGENSVVAICLGKIANVFNEAALEVVELQADGTWQAIEDHPLLDLLAQPNQIDDLNSLTVAWTYSYKVDGNSYLIATLANGGQPAQLDWVPFWEMEPKSDDPTVAIQYYLRTVDGQKIRYEPEQVWHFRDGKDPRNPRLGCSRLKRQIMELAADNEASVYTAVILHNMGIIGGILTSEDPDVEVTETVAEKLKRLWREMTTGSARGGLLVPTFKAKFTEAGRSPEEMALDIIRQIPQARIAAALDVPLQVAQLPAKDVSGSYANYSEAREAFWEECLMPLHTRFTDGLTRYALPLYGDAIRGARRRRVRYNYEEVRALQPDMDKESTRALAEWQADAITLNQTLEKLREEPLPDAEGDVYYSEHTGAMKQKFAPPPALPSQGPDSPGDAMASGRTPPFGREAGLHGVNGNGKAAVKTVEEAEALKAELGAKWRERRRLAEEGENGDPFEPAAKFNPNHDPHSGRFAGGQGGHGVGQVTHVHESREYGPIAMRPATDEERKALDVPPAYSNVHVPVHPESPILYKAETPSGKDKQVPSPEHKAAADIQKFQRVKALDAALPALRQKWDAEIQSGGRNAHEALALRLVSQAGFRNGGDEAQTALRQKNPETGQREIVGHVQTFGASTLRAEHARVEGDRVHFDFQGKGNVRQQHTVTDPVLARHVEARRVAGHATLFDTSDARTRDYLQRTSGEPFKVHDLRTRHATATAAAVMKRIDARGETPKTAAELETQTTRAIKVAARRIGDSEAVARSSYVNPEVFLRWQSGLN